jgi:PilZ domain-containing protein
MNDLFELVFEYRTLLAQRRAEGEKLGLPARSRLDALHRLLGREPTDAQGTRPGELGRRKHARCDVSLGALLRLGPRAVAVEVVNLGAGGVCIRAAEGPRIGERAVLRLTSPDTGRIYECIAETTWRQDGEQLSGMRFLGAPLLVQLAS